MTEETVVSALWSRSGLIEDVFVNLESVEEIIAHEAVIIPLQL